jgi:hypothetical protein
MTQRVVCTAIVIASLLVSTTACSVVTVKRPTSDLSARTLECTQSNWAAGVDMVLAVAGGLALGNANNSEVVPAVLATTGAAASMVYGFRHTSRCRDRARKLKRNVSGGTDWLYAPGAVVVVALAVLAVAALANGGDPDLCEPGERRTAICNDGVYSCSTNRSGTCSWHQGVYVWL